MNDQRKTKKALIQELNSLEYADSIINTVREPLISLDQDLRVVTASRSFYDFFKVKPEETVGQLIYNLGNKQWDIPKLRELLETILPEKTTFDNYEVEHDFTTIGRRIMLLNARQIKRALGKERIILLAIEDITERKRAEEELSKSEKKYRELYDFLPIPVYEMDLEANITSANRAIYETFRGTEEDLKKGFKGWQLLSHEEIEKSAKNIQMLLIGAAVQGTEYTLMRLDGSVFPAIVISSVIYSDGKPVGLRGAIIDITERKRMDETLRARDALYRTLVETSPDVILLVDLSLNIVMVNLQTLSVFGYASTQEVIGRSAIDFIVPEHHARIVEDAQNILGGGVL
jgi:PAS domain S-box-containing protein